MLYVLDRQILWTSMSARQCRSAEGADVHVERDVFTRPDDSSLRSAAHSARIYTPRRGGAARNGQMTRGMSLAWIATGGDFRGLYHPSRVEMRGAPADGNAESPTRSLERRSVAGGGSVNNNEQVNSHHSYSGFAFDSVARRRCRTGRRRRPAAVRGRICTRRRTGEACGLSRAGIVR